MHVHCQQANRCCQQAGAEDDKARWRYRRETRRGKAQRGGVANRPMAPTDKARWRLQTRLGRETTPAGSQGRRVGGGGAKIIFAPKDALCAQRCTCLQVPGLGVLHACGGARRLRSGGLPAPPSLRLAPTRLPTVAPRSPLREWTRRGLHCQQRECTVGTWVGATVGRGGGGGTRRRGGGAAPRPCRENREQSA